MSNKYRKWFGEQRCKKAMKVFSDKGWTAFYAETKEDAYKLLFDEIIPKNVSIGLGGSETLTAMNVLPVLRNGDYKLFDRYNCENHFEVCRDSLMADYFLTGANALTLNGEMVNLDCSGSRVAAMAYGPRKVVVVAGVNKICASLDEAITRVQSIAPMNCRRNNHATPCTQDGICTDCNIPARMCNQLLVTRNAQKFAGRYTLVLINEDLGF
jgi:L-lactate utilization protein LutB